MRRRTVDRNASYQWAFLNTGELRLVPSHTAAVDAAIGAITGSPALSADGTVRSLEGIDINIVPAWKKYDAKSEKRQVIVALIDTGVDITHPELSGSIWTNTGEIPGDGIDNDGNGYVDDVNGWNFVSNSNEICTGEEDSHGTHGAGTIAAAWNNGGIAGITDSTHVKLMVLHAVVAVHLSVPLAADGQVKIPMPGEQLQHVVQEPHPGGDVRLPSAVQV